MEESGCAVTFENGGVSIRRDGRVLAEEPRIGYHYTWNMTDVHARFLSDSALLAILDLCHKRLADVHVDRIINKTRKKVVSGMTVDISKTEPVWTSYIVAKSTNTAVLKHSCHRSDVVSGLVLTDVCSRVFRSLGGPKYFVTVIDDYFCYCRVYSTTQKSEIFETFKKWLEIFERQTKSKLKVLYFNNGWENTFNEIKDFLLENVIISWLTTSY